MGSLVKRLGQWSRKSLESESASIFKKLKANKIPGSLSQKLDLTLKEGHDMTIFGLGTLATMSSRTQYQQFLINLHAIYSTMEEELDVTASPTIKSQVIKQVWQPQNETILRRSQHLLDDIQEIQLLLEDDWEKQRTSPSLLRKSMLDNQPPPALEVARVSPNTLQYLQSIRLAGESDRETGGGRLLGHFYCRYFADLFGGQMLGRPYQLALQLPTTPRHLEFDFAAINRQEVLERLYEDLNHAGKLLDLPQQQMDDIQKESLLAFRHNVMVYSEQQSGGIITNAAKGGFNCILGWATSSPANTK